MHKFKKKILHLTSKTADLNAYINTKPVLSKLITIPYNVKLQPKTPYKLKRPKMVNFKKEKAINCTKIEK